ncbi:hypothetical protein HYV43_04085 [Candidatus Micrarchaeota archaeon]|nr:hypothetical protein [Candidatus Micrarchaeota archaeon]
MTIAEDVASLWQGVKPVPPKGAEAAYYADLLRRLMLSKKQLEETGRKYSILPDLRELTRRTMVRIPAQHVAYLEVSVFDLISNPLKTHLQPYVSEFSTQGADFELVSWFVRHAKKEPSLALDYKALQAWFDQHTPVEPAPITSAEPQPAIIEEKKEPPASSGPPSADSDTSPFDETSGSSASNKESPVPASDAPSSSTSASSETDTTVPTPVLPESDGTNADRIFEHE